MLIIIGDIDLPTAEKIRAKFVKWLAQEADYDTKSAKMASTQKGRRFYEGRSFALQNAARFWQEVQFQTTAISD